MREAPHRIHIKPTHPQSDDLDWYVWSDGTPYILATPAALAASPEVQALIETTLAALQDPLVVHLNMVAGKIAKPLPSQLVHIYGEDVIRSAFAALIREAEARGMERAADICEGIRTRIANGPMPEGARFDYEQAIRAEAAAIRKDEEPK